MNWPVANPTRPGAAETGRAIKLGRRSRRFSLLDGMILVAGMGLAVAGCRPQYYERSGMRLPFTLLAMAGVCLVVLTFSILALRLRHPRPPLRRLVRQPGFLACLGASVAMVMGIADGLAVEFIHGGWSRVAAIVQDVQDVLNRMPESAPICGTVVLVSWVVLAIGRHAGPSPAGSTGRAWSSAVPGLQPGRRG